MKRIMITAAGGPAGFCLAKYLRGRAYLIGLDSNTFSPAQFFCDETHLVPSATASNYKETMLEVIEKSMPDIIIPTFDEDLLFFTSVRDQIPCFVLLSPGETIHICDDKLQTVEMFADIVTKTFTLDEASTQCLYPLHIRPSRGRGSKIGYKVENDFDLEYACKKLQEPIIQEWLPGPEVTVDSFADLEGRLLGIAPRIRVQTRGGISTKAQFIKDEHIEIACRIVHERLKIVGPTNIQFLKGIDGSWRLSEINPRYGGGLGLSFQAGFDSITPLLTIDPKQGTLIAGKMTPKYGITVVRYWEERVVDG